MSVVVPHGLAEIIAAYGDPKFDGHQVDPRWESANMVVVRDLPLVPKLYVHRLILEPLRRALNVCAQLGDGYELRHIGCFNPRLQRASSTLMSLHTFGIAVDLNPDQNPLIAPCAVDDPKRLDQRNHDLPDAWIAAFEQEGFFWGGEFQHRFDPMHFQLATGY